MLRRYVAFETTGACSDLAGPRVVAFPSLTTWAVAGPHGRPRLARSMLALPRLADASRSSELKMRKEIDMKMTTIVLALALLAVGGCKSAGSTHCGKQDALSRCGGGGQPGSPGGPIVAGTDNPFFAATSRQFIKIKPGVDIKSDVGSDGKGHKLTLISRDSSLVVSCRCPSGCGESGDGCFYWIEEGSRNALCLGDCATDTSCCFGCGWH